MSLLAVYDTMVFLQWAALPEGRRHATIQALYNESVHLFMSQALLDEVRDVLSRPSVVARAPNITPNRLKQVLAAILERAEWVTNVPALFTWPHHPADDHIFNLAIAVKAHRLITWEERILSIDKNFPRDAERLRTLAPQLRIISPRELSDELKPVPPQAGRSGATKLELVLRLDMPVSTRLMRGIASTNWAARTAPKTALSMGH